MIFITRLLRMLFGTYQRENTAIAGFTGALKDLEDERDYVIGSIASSLELPEEVSLKEYVREVKCQGKINSCVAHAICSMIEIMLQIDGPQRYIQLSERYNYYFGRKKSNLFPDDKGMYPRDAIKSAKEDGITTELLWPYNENINKEPGIVAKSIAHIYGAIIGQYYRVYSNISIKEQLTIARPVLISVPVYDYWPSNGSGNIRKPTLNDNLIGYHAMVVVGYFKGYFEVLNSWNGWGKEGYCNLPEDYERVDNWVIELKE